MKGPSSLLLAALLGLLSAAASGCACGTTPCETDFDCYLICQCASGRTQTASFACSAGVCNPGYDEAADCADLCGPGGLREDDDDDAGDDDDSGGAGPDDDDSGL